MPSSELSVMFCYVYVLKSDKNNSFYVGFTHNLNKRMTEHNAGLSFSTKPYLPWSLVYYEAHRNEVDARRREGYLKTTQGKMALHRMLREQFSQLGNLNHGKATTRYA